MTPEQLAQLFHETYERLAPDHGYETREASAKPWADVPEQNRGLMVAVAGEVLDALAPGTVAERAIAFWSDALLNGSGVTQRATASQELRDWVALQSRLARGL